ncbi:MAG: twin-arginine translocase subunit TatC [Planctomycetia bacterium]|nr:twin-arginine translocase subunit TatC [Planctomycetia bacterium]
MAKANSRPKYDEDLFRESTMTFGEHLEELRKCLWKAIVGLVFVFILTLIPPVDLADRAVEFISGPLIQALRDYYVGIASKNYTNDQVRLKALGVSVPSAAAFDDTIHTDRMVPTLVFIDAPSVLKDLQQRYPGTFEGPTVPNFTPGDFVDVRNFCQYVEGERKLTEANPSKRVWELLSAEVQKLVQKIAAIPDGQTPEPGDVQALAAAVERIVNDPKFFREADYQQIAAAGLVEYAITTYHGRQHDRYLAIKDSGVAPNSPAYNRLLLSAAYPDAVAAGPRQSAMMPLFTWQPVENDFRASLKSLNAQEMFMIWIKAAFVVSFVVASPWVFYQLWTFIGAGLYPHEKRYVYLYGPISAGLFIAGALLAFFFAFKPLLGFLLYFNEKMGVDPDIRISEWFGFALFLPLGFGISFQLPIVMLFLERIGIFTVKSYVSRWRGAILVICIAAMFLTPSGDPYSMLLMAVPLVFLYFGGIFLCKYMPKGRNPFAEE